MRTFGEQIAVDTIGPGQATDEQGWLFGSLDQVLESIAKHADPKFNPKNLKVSENVAKRLITRTPGLVLSVVCDAEAEQAEESLKGLDTTSILTINNSLKNACDRSKHPDSEIVGRYVCGYDIAHIAMLQGFASSDTVFETVFSNPGILSEIIGSPYNVRNIRAKSQPPDSIYEFIEGDAGDHFVEPPAIISRSLV